MLFDFKKGLDFNLPSNMTLFVNGLNVFCDRVAIEIEVTNYRVWYYMRFHNHDNVVAQFTFDDSYTLDINLDYYNTNKYEFYHMEFKLKSV